MRYVVCACRKKSWTMCYKCALYIIVQLIHTDFFFSCHYICIKSMTHTFDFFITPNQLNKYFFRCSIDFFIWNCEWIDKYFSVVALTGKLSINLRSATSAFDSSPVVTSIKGLWFASWVMSMSVMSFQLVVFWIHRSNFPLHWSPLATIID